MLGDGCLSASTCSFTPPFSFSGAGHFVQPLHTNTSSSALSFLRFQISF